MPKLMNWNRLDFFIVIIVTTLISSVSCQWLGAAEASSSAKSIPERLEKVRQQVQFLQTLAEVPTAEGESATSPEADQDRDHLSQWPNWANWSDQWTNWPNWQDWTNY